MKGTREKLKGGAYKDVEASAGNSCRPSKGGKVEGEQLTYDLVVLGGKEL